MFELNWIAYILRYHGHTSWGMVIHLEACFSLKMRVIINKYLHVACLVGLYTIIILMVSSLTSTSSNNVMYTCTAYLVGYAHACKDAWSTCGEAVGRYIYSLQQSDDRISSASSLNNCYIYIHLYYKMVAYRVKRSISPIVLNGRVLIFCRLYMWPS